MAKSKFQFKVTENGSNNKANLLLKVQINLHVSGKVLAFIATPVLTIFGFTPIREWIQQWLN